MTEEGTLIIVLFEFYLPTKKFGLLKESFFNKFCNDKKNYPKYPRYITRDNCF